MMLWNDGKIYQVVVGKILHVMRMAHWAIMYLTLTYLFHGIIIMESSSATHHIDNLTIALMNMKTS